MNRRIVALNVVLIGLAALLAWQVRQRRQEAAAGERAVLLKRGKEQAVLAPPAPVPARPVAPAEYIDTVQRMLFSKDRNPNVIVEVPPPAPPPKPPPPMPALPFYYGQLHFGGPPVIELRLVNAKEQKGYEAGDQVGDFTVVSFDSDSVTFEWNGQEVVRKVADLKPKQEQQPQAAAPPPPAQSSASSSGVIAIGGSDSNSAASGVPDVVGPDVGGGFYGCKPGDATPSGTVVSGYQKTSSQGLMGPSCRWERLNK